MGDLEKSLAWYQDRLGFTVDRRYERGGRLQVVAMRAGAVRLLIGQDDGTKGPDRVKGEGASLQITTDQDVDALANRVKASGGVLELEPVDTPWGARVFRVRDPDGFKLAISSSTSPWCGPPPARCSCAVSSRRIIDRLGIEADIANYASVED